MGTSSRCFGLLHSARCKSRAPGVARLRSHVPDLRDVSGTVEPVTFRGKPLDSPQRSPAHKAMLPERFQRLRSVLDRRQPDLTVLMERVNKAHNLSAILRNCDAVGVLDVHAVYPKRGLKLHRDTSAGTAKWIGMHEHTDGPSAVRFLQEAGFQVVAADPGRRSVDFREVDYTGPTALLMGAELYGVTPESLALVDVTVRIPMVGMARSLNVSVATSLLLYEAFRQRDSSGAYLTPRLDPERRRQLLFEWAYPEIARQLRDAGRSYPALDERGTILNDPQELSDTTLRG